MPQLPSRKANRCVKREIGLRAKHDYIDHYYDPTCVVSQVDSSSKRKGPRGGVVTPFPEKLYHMLSVVEEEGLGNIVSWQPSGRCFLVHDPKRFVDEVLPRQAKILS